MTAITTRSEAETAAEGRRFAASLHGGEVLLLSGDLGAGKTAFVRGLAEGLGVDPHDVTSPTFTLVQEYARAGCRCFTSICITSRSGVDDLGLDEMSLAGGVLAIEWPDRLPRTFADAVNITFAHGAGDERVIDAPLQGPRIE